MADRPITHEEGSKGGDRSILVWAIVSALTDGLDCGYGFTGPRTCGRDYSAADHRSTGNQRRTNAAVASCGAPKALHATLLAVSAAASAASACLIASPSVKPPMNWRSNPPPLSRSPSAARRRVTRSISGENVFAATEGANASRSAGPRPVKSIGPLSAAPKVSSSSL